MSTYFGALLSAPGSCGFTYSIGATSFSDDFTHITQHLVANNSHYLTIYFLPTCCCSYRWLNSPISSSYAYVPKAGLYRAWLMTASCCCCCISDRRRAALGLGPASSSPTSHAAAAVHHPAGQHADVRIVAPQPQQQPIAHTKQRRTCGASAVNVSRTAIKYLCK